MKKTALKLCEKIPYEEPTVHQCVIEVGKIMAGTVNPDAEAGYVGTGSGQTGGGPDSDSDGTGGTFVF
ncbi:MAG: hypothetical protein LBN29_14330 [Mediterranea sp.]|jgi:hypothetical protein|nr:hypothetical protein [Mediterranea sp.]